MTADVDWLFSLPPPEPKIGRPSDDEDGIDVLTYAVWGDAIFAALEGDNSAIIEMLRGTCRITPAVREFLVYLLDRPDNRPPLPPRFAALRELIRLRREPRFLQAVLRFLQMRAAWEDREGDLPFPRKAVIARLAAEHKLNVERFVNYFSHGDRESLAAQTCKRSQAREASHGASSTHGQRETKHMSSIRIVQAYIQDSAPRFTNIQELETLISEGYELAACVYVGTETPLGSNFLVYTMVKK